MDGVQAAIDEFNSQTGAADLRSAASSSRTGRSRSTWTTRTRAVRHQGGRLRRPADRPGRSTSPTTSSGAVAAATRAPSRVQVGQARRTAAGHRAAVRHSFETFRNPGPCSRCRSTARTQPRSRRTPAPPLLRRLREPVRQLADASGGRGETLDSGPGTSSRRAGTTGSSRRWWAANGSTVPLVDDAGDVVTTNDDPHGGNTEGNGLTGTSGGAYFVDEPEYVHLTAQLPAGATDVRFRYSTDAAYLDTGWFVDDVMLNGAAACPRPSGEWIATTGIQDNNWTLQVISSCDLTAGVHGARDHGRRGQLRLPLRATPIDHARCSDGQVRGQAGDRDRDLQPARQGTFQFLERAVRLRAGLQPEVAGVQGEPPPPGRWRLDRSDQSAASSSSSAGVSCQAPAATFAATCSGFVAPAITDATPDRPSHRSPAPAACVRARLANASSASIRSQASRSVRSSRVAEPRARGLRLAAAVLAGQQSAASGKYGM